MGRDWEYIFMLQEPEQAEFSEGALGEDFVLEGLLNLFDGNEVVLLVKSVIPGGHNNPISSLAD